MNDNGHNNGDFADEPTDPGIDASARPGSAPGGSGQDEASDAMKSLGFRPQTGAFGAVGGPPNAQGQQPAGGGQQTFRPGGPPQSGQQANPFQGKGSGPQSGQQQPQNPQAPVQQGLSSGSFAPPMANPTGSFNVSTGEFSAPNAPGPASTPSSGAFAANPQSGSFQVNSGPATGSFNAPNRQANPPQPGGQQSGANFSPPMSGSFQAVPGAQGQNAAQQVPGQQPPNAPGQQGYVTGQMQGIQGQQGYPQNAGQTGSFPAPGPNQSLQIGEYVEKPPEPTIKVRAAFGGGGFLFGAIVGLALGLLNSVFEGVGILAGLSVTIQIAIWFGGMIGLIAAWKPQKVWETLESYGFFD